MDFSSFTEEAFAAYLAGFTDGEGCIYIKQPSGYGACRVTLANCVEEVLIGIMDRLGYGSMKSQQQRGNWRERFTFDVYNAKDCERFLLLVRPYLKIKADQADAALQRIADQYSRTAGRLARNAAIVAAANNGEKRRDVAKRFGVSPQTVSRLCEGHNWPSERSDYAKRKQRNNKGQFTV